MQSAEKTRDTDRAYRAKNADRIRAMKRARYARKREEILAKHKAWRDANPDRRRDFYERIQKPWKKANPEKVKEKARKYAKKKYAKAKERLSDPIARAKKNAKLRAFRMANPGFKIAMNMRRRMARALKGTAKPAHTMEILGCTQEAAIKFIEAQWKEGMTWNNYGTHWHIDHKRPCASFDFRQEDDIRKCFHFTNLQPLWAWENFQKSAKWEGGSN